MCAQTSGPSWPSLIFFISPSRLLYASNIGFFFSCYMQTHSKGTAFDAFFFLIMFPPGLPFPQIFACLILTHLLRPKLRRHFPLRSQVKLKSPFLCDPIMTSANLCSAYKGGLNHLYTQREYDFFFMSSVPITDLMHTFVYFLE